MKFKINSQMLVDDSETVLVVLGLPVTFVEYFDLKYLTEFDCVVSV